MKDKYGGSAGGLSTSNSSTAPSSNPTLSDRMTGLTNGAVGYRSANGVSITNRDEYAGALARQQHAVNEWDNFSTWAPIAARLPFGKGPSVAAGDVSHSCR